MRAPALIALLTLPLHACAPKAVPEVAMLGLDCALPFEAQAAKLASQPRLTPAPEDRAEPYLYFSSDDGTTSYLITKPTAPAHPAIMMQRAHNGVTTRGCAYGDREAYDKLLAYLEGLKTWRS